MELWYISVFPLHVVIYFILLCIPSFYSTCFYQQNFLSCHTVADIINCCTTVIELKLFKTLMWSYTFYVFGLYLNGPNPLHSRRWFVL
jgi:hypothetical protein